MVSAKEEREPAVGTSERRRWTRYPVDVALRAHVRSEGTAKTVHGRGSDVSMGGMAAYIAAELVMGETIELDVTLPYTACPLKLRAVVRSRRGYQYGVEYVNVTSVAAAAIQRACASLALVQ